MSKEKICKNPTCNNIRQKDKWGNYKQYCSDECMKISRSLKFKETYKNKDMNAILEKRKSTLKEKYGVDNASRIPEVIERLRITTAETANVRIEKTKLTNIKRYGVESTNSLQEVKEKKKRSFIEKYGVDHQLKIPDVAKRVANKNSQNSKERLEKSAITKEERYGDENYNNREKYKETCIEKFGAENPSQNAEIHEKQFKNSVYDYIFPSGKIVRIQGYENRALDILLKYFNEEDITVGKCNIPEIWYNLGRERHRYFPDVYISKENLIIEVKSQWTYNKDNETLRKNLAKKDGCINLGYKHLFMIFDSTGKNLLTEVRW